MMKLFFRVSFSSRASTALRPATAANLISFDEDYWPAPRSVVATPEAYPPFETELELHLPTTRVGVGVRSRA
jgi:hypothetical protein